MSAPLISVIMPAYNAERYIQKAIESVLTQSCQDFELIVLNDGSTDATETIVNAFDDVRIRLISLPRIGKISVLRNEGLKAARGKYIAFMDSDDLYEVDALANLSTHLEKTPACHAVYGFFRWIDENDQFSNIDPWFTIHEDGHYQFRPRHEHTWENILTGGIPTWLQGLMFRREILERIPAFNEQVLINEDALFFIELFLADFEGVHRLPQYVFRYRNYAASITKHKGSFQDILNNQKTFLDFLLNHPQLSENVSPAIMGRVCRFHLHSIAITRLIFNQPAYTRQICLWTLRHAYVPRPQWFRYFLHLLILSYIPESPRNHFFKQFKTLKLSLKTLKHRMLLTQPA